MLTSGKRRKSRTPTASQRIVRGLDSRKERGQRCSFRFLWSVQTYLQAFVDQLRGFDAVQFE